MGDLDLDNCIKLFKLEDGKSPEQANNNVYAIKPVRELNVFQAIPHLDNEEGTSQTGGDWNCAKFSETGIEELIKFRTELEDLFNDCGDILGISAVLWEEISCRLFENGIRVTGKQCHDKWNSLYNDYRQLAKTDDEGKILSFRHFATFEKVYKIRSEFLVEKIVEDVVKFESECGSSTEEIVNDISKSEDNVKEQNDEEKKEEDHAVEKMKLRSHGKKKESQARDAAWSSCNREECRENVLATEFNLVEIKADCSSEDIQFCWDADSMQCFIDLRLYVDSSPQIKKTVLARYKSIAKFLSKKMLLNGFQISEHDCKRKWNSVIRLYNKEVNNLRAMGEKNINKISLSKYFHQINKVLKKYGRSELADEFSEVYWTDESVRTLIEKRIPLERAFTEFKSYAILWQHVANQITKANFFPTYKDCAIKWMKLCENYDICLRAMKIGLTEEKIGWKFFMDMRNAFEQNTKNPEAIIEYLEANDSGKDFESFGEIKIEASPAQYSTTPECLINSETPAIGNLEILEKIEDPIVFYSMKAEDKEDPMKVIGIPKEEILDKVEDKAPSLKNDENFGEYCKTFAQSDFSCDKECNCPKSMLQWNDQATLLLLGWRRNKESEFKNTTLDNVELWKFIAKRMRNVGYNVCYESCRSYWYHLKEIPKRLILASKKNTGSEKARNNSIESSKISTAKNNSFVWDWRSVTVLIELKFCEGIRELIKYGKTIASRMQAVGYNVTSTDCTSKWIKLKENYNRCLKRKLAGRDIKWEYFQLMNRHFENLASEMELDIKNGKLPPQWIYNCIQNLTKLKSLYEKSLVETESVNQSHESNYITDPVNSQVEDIISVKGKRKANEEFEGGGAVKKLSTCGKNIQQVSEPIRVSDKDEEMIEETTAVDLSTKVIVPISEQNSPQNMTAKYYLDAYKCNKKVEITKENVACLTLDKNNGTPLSEKIIGSREMSQFRILCEQKPRNEIFSANKVEDNRAEASVFNKSQSLIELKYNVPIQDQSVNSTQHFRAEKKSGWSEAATDLLIDLRIEHEFKFPSGYSERSDILWDKIAAQMAATDYNFTRAECWQKWCSLRRTYENMIEDIQEKRVIQAWPYFGKLDSIYKTLGKIYRGYKWILPKKRTHVEVDDNYNDDSRELNLSLSNKLIILVLPSNSTDDEIPISDTEN